MVDRDLNRDRREGILVAGVEASKCAQAFAHVVEGGTRDAINGRCGSSRARGGLRVDRLDRWGRLGGLGSVLGRVNGPVGGYARGPVVLEQERLTGQTRVCFKRSGCGLADVRSAEINI